MNTMETNHMYADKEGHSYKVIPLAHAGLFKL